MKKGLLILSFILIALGVLATPLGIVLGVHDWVSNDVEFKVALWYGLKVWLSSLVVGLGAGYPLFLYSIK